MSSSYVQIETKIPEERSLEFQLDSFISQIVLWNDREIVSVRPEFSVLSSSNRMALICSELARAGVAVVEVGYGSAMVWRPVDEIERDCGGSDIATPSRITTTAQVSSPLGRKFERAIKKHFRRRLSAMLRVTVALFSNYNDGLIRITGVHENGAYIWGATEDRRQWLI